MMADLAKAETVIENGAAAPAPAPAAERENSAASVTVENQQQEPQQAAGAVASPQPSQPPVPAKPAVEGQLVLPDWAATEQDRKDPGVPLNVKIPTDLFYELRDFCSLTRIKQKDVVAEAVRKQLALLKFERAEAARLRRQQQKG